MGDWEKTTDAPSFDPAQDKLAALAGQAPNYVLIIDQFEEIITTHGERWRERAVFFQQLEAAMVADPTLWVVLTLREDFVASLDPYALLLSDKLRARYYMQRMGVEAARQAISRPAEARQRRFQPAAIDLLLNSLSQVRVAGKASTESGQYIEPVQLQVVCYQLWEGLKNRFAPLISTEDVQKAGDVDRALASFYEETIVAALQIVPLAGGERRLRRWFEEKLLTEAGTRGTVYQGEHETAGLPNELVLELANRFLLRSEARSGGRWVELTHDRFVEPIVAANRAWETKQNNPLAAVTRLWLENGRDPARLLRGPQLLDAQTFAAAQGELLRQAERDFLAASAQAEAAEQARLAEAARQAELARLQSEAAAQQNRTRTLWRVVTVVTVLALIALVATGWALQARRAATRAQATAEAASVLAQQNAQAAATSEALAQQERLVAETAREAAQEQAAAAEAARAETKKLQEQITADRMAQIAALTHINQNLPHYPQRALLLALEAAQMITSPLPSSLTTLHDLLGRTGGVGLSGHDAPVTSVAFALDGQTLASGSADNTIRLWSLAEPSADPVVLRGHDAPVTSVAFAPDGQTLASGSYDNTIRLWRVSAADILALACTTASRNLSMEEWQRYFPNQDYERTCRNQPLPSSFRREAAALAQGGKIMDAISIYQRMRELDPRLTFDPEQEANREFAKTVVISATQLAQSGEITAAVTTYQEALRLDPTLAITPEKEAKRQSAIGGIQQAAELARSSKIIASLTAISQAIQLDSQVVIGVDIWGDLCRYGSWTDQVVQILDACEKAVAAEPQDSNIRDGRGVARARAGDLSGAIEDFTAYVAWSKQNNQYEPWGKQREGWLAALKVGVNVVDAYALASNSKINEALAIYAELKQVDPKLQLSADDWYNLCWYGSWTDQVVQVLDACEEAVAAEPQDGNIRDGRGVARARTGDLSGAIEDFTAYVAWSKQNNQYEPWGKQREGWLAALKAGVNVVDAYVLAYDGKINEALAIYAELKQVDPKLQLSADDWYNLCWYGSLYDFAARVLEACTKGVTALEGYIAYDARGIARALTGDVQGAIEDFELFVKWAKDTGQHKSLIPEREAFIVDLKAGKNPFNAATLQRLREATLQRMRKE